MKNLIIFLMLLQAPIILAQETFTSRIKSSFKNAKSHLMAHDTVSIYKDTAFKVVMMPFKRSDYQTERKDGYFIFKAVGHSKNSDLDSARAMAFLNGYEILKSQVSSETKSYLNNVNVKDEKIFQKKDEEYYEVFILLEENEKDVHLCRVGICKHN
ncbi:MAG: hypothetical protein WAV23_03585 [Minisyncoccia bacterium]